MAYNYTKTYIQSRQRTIIIKKKPKIYCITKALIIGSGLRLWWFITTFNKISVISVAASHLQTLSQNVVSSTPRHERDSNSQL